MRFGRLPFILPVVMLPAVAAVAHDHNAEKFVAYTPETGSFQFFGIGMSYEHYMMPPDDNKPTKRRPLSVVTEGNVSFGSERTRVKGLGGPRLSFGGDTW